MSHKIREFMKWHQEKMTVAWYTTKFDELVRFASIIISNDDARKKNFMMRLRLKIVVRVDTGSKGPKSYADAV